MNQYIRPTLALFIGLTLITGVAYPLATTGLGKMLFPQQAAGSLIERDGKIVGSTLIGQNFSTPQYFWGRPSATAPYPYNAAASSGTNQGPLNPALADAVKARIATLKAADPDSHLPVPVDLVTASASGLDPEISPAAALFQVRRVAQARQLAEDSVKNLVNEYTQGRQWGLLGEPRVNVLQLNLALDDMARHSAPLKQ